MSLRDLPTLNAVLNATTAVLLATGWLLIRRGRREAHRKVMTAALVSSSLFLVSYLAYHARAGTTRFQGTGAIRTAYLGILLTHTVLAAVVAPLAVIVFVLARRARFRSHRRVARWTLPAWLYVSATGVAVYLMLYRPGFTPPR